ncbi:hypothetical protein [Natranaerobius thermophilus]|uniref:Uncharacterized protein n=1 Tax=Natranaerobius thermophilus (strain ATCC BAA-1301 / DSM 18059 / JW/NM-WN-LF) TaxID=457570 RepID=B2A0S2_NATTJ|nr:hypothetical protein [Natranaerobius thermophilus]ACB85952.1 conserved hypothetical protein [Natranaerobius thermophilus JW/NM-WN-LF]
MSKKLALIITVTVLGALLLGQAVWAGAVNVSEPGSKDDPLVTESYVEEVLKDELKYDLQDELLEEVDKKLQDQLAQLNDLEDLDMPQGNLDKFEVVQVEAGDTIMAGDGTEMILRAGRGNAITSPQGGIADLTAGNDIDADEDIPRNHHLLFPRDDGRGMSIRHKAYIMVRGDYEIQPGN